MQNQNSSNQPQPQNQETTSDKVLKGFLKLGEVLAKIFIETLKIILKILEAFGVFAGKHPIIVVSIIGLICLFAFTYYLLTDYEFQTLAINAGGLAIVIALVVGLVQSRNNKPVSSGKKGKTK